MVDIGQPTQDIQLSPAIPYDQQHFLQHLIVHLMKSICSSLLFHTKLTFTSGLDKDSTSVTDTEPFHNLGTRQLLNTLSRGCKYHPPEYTYHGLRGSIQTHMASTLTLPFTLSRHSSQPPTYPTDLVIRRSESGTPEKRKRTPSSGTFARFSPCCHCSDPLNLAEMGGIKGGLNRLHRLGSTHMNNDGKCVQNSDQWHQTDHIEVWRWVHLIKFTIL